MKQKTRKELYKANNRQIGQAGARYTPGQDPNAPNIRIDYISDLMNFAVFHNNYQIEIDDLKVRVTKELKERSKLREFKGFEGDHLLHELDVLLSIKSKSSLRRLNSLRKRMEDKRNKAQSYLYGLYEQEQSAEKINKESINSLIHSFKKLNDLISEVSEVISSKKASALVNKNILIMGSWGTGKTHLLCDLAKNLMSESWPVFFILAHRIEMNSDPIDGYLKANSISKSRKSFLSSLNNEAKQKKIRALLIIDGVNEGDRKEWAKLIYKLKKELDRYKNIVLVVSCRTPFEELMFSKKFRSEFLNITHHGFSDIEFDAQLEFFKYYSVSAPEVPLLSHEFSRPLFLKIICKSLQDLSKRVKAKHWKEILSGQKSLNHILETFVAEVTSPLVLRDGRHKKFYWNLIKDSGVGGESIAKTMGEKSRNYLYPNELKSIIRARTNKTGKDSKVFINEMIDVGILSEDVEWNENKTKKMVPKVIYRLPYEKFSDHIVARYLFDLIDFSTPESVRQAFSRDSAIGAIFNVSEQQSRYAIPSLAEALMLEFPERMKNVPWKGSREVYFWLPEENKLASALIEPFISGLYWRTSDSFTKDTSIIINHILKDRWEKNEMLEALVSISTRSSHPKNAAYLFNCLSKMELTKRDLFWSEWIRSSYEYSIVSKLPRWIEINSKSHVDFENTLNLVVLCSLFLSSTNLYVRDIFTRSLTILGGIHPRALFQHTLQCLSINDPYIQERMLAATYGCLINNQIEFLAGEDKEEVVTFAAKLYKSFFGHGGVYTHNVLIRDHVVNILKYLSHRPDFGKTKIKKSFLKKLPKRRVLIPSSKKIKASSVKDAENVFMMDFENYTLGRLVKGRANYDMKNPAFVGLRKRFLWRVTDLGYKSEDFKEIDRQIRDRHWRDSDPNKVERYGKKYSWIAYYELYGELRDQGLLNDYLEDGRISDCGVDPSFPAQMDVWKPRYRAVFQPKKFEGISLKEWIQSGFKPNYSKIIQAEVINLEVGPWIMLDGFLSETDTAKGIEIFSFVRGFLVSKKDVSLLKKVITQREYLGNHFLPETPSDHYTYAGEVPFGENFSSQFRYSDGGAKRNIQTISFDKEVLEKKAIKKAWENLSKISSEGSVEEGHRPFLSLEISKLLRLANKGLPKEEHLNFFDYYDPPTAQDLENGFTIKSVNKEFARISVELPTYDLAWESYHSSLNKGSGSVPSLSILQTLNLYKKSEQLRFVEKSGRLAALHVDIDIGGKSYGRSHGTFLRKDLLQRYMKKYDQVFVWIIWGERGINYEVFEEHRDELVEARQDHNDLHRRIVVLDEK